jgi:hypothetical protein
MTNNKQQTAVEWYIEMLLNLDYEYAEGLITLGIYTERKNSLKQQAKEMEKEHHATTWDKAMDNLDARGGNIVRAYVDFDEYYNETYGGGEQ